jgi:hypothetical protein
MLQACGSGAGLGGANDPPANPSSANSLALTITAPGGQVRVGRAVQLVAHRHYPSGGSDDVTTTVAWQSSENRIASFETPAMPGLLTSKAAGSVLVTAALDGETVQAVISVIPDPVRAKGPLRVSSANPRYFEADHGVPILLAGSHTWLNMQDSGTTPTPEPFDYVGFLDLLTAHGHNFFRLWAWEQARWSLSETRDDNWLAPNIYERTGPGTALDGKPKFDLDRFNQAYFDRMRERVEQAADRGIYVSIMLFNGFSVAKSKPSSPPQNRNPWHGHPFNALNNINNVNGDPNGNDSGEETHELVVPAITQYQEAYVRKVIDTVNDLDNVLYEISNESHGNSREWQYRMIRMIHEYETTKPRQHPVGMTVEWPDGNNDELFASNAEWISPNGDIDARPIADGRKVMLVDTDHLCGVCGDRGWVWRSVTAGENPVLMDPYNFLGHPDRLPGIEVNTAALVGARQNLGYAIQITNRMDLARARPSPTLASTGYCLADLTSLNPSVLVYSPGGGTITVNLQDVPSAGSFRVEWLNPEMGTVTTAGTTAGGARRSLQAPFSGESVLFLFSAT